MLHRFSQAHKVFVHCRPSFSLNYRLDVESALLVKVLVEISNLSIASDDHRPERFCRCSWKMYAPENGMLDGHWYSIHGYPRVPTVWGFWLQIWSHHLWTLLQGKGDVTRRTDRWSSISVYRVDSPSARWICGSRERNHRTSESLTRLWKTSIRLVTSWTVENSSLTRSCHWFWTFSWN